jgi:hypothetical protein
MNTTLKHLPTSALIVACVALVVALGGVSYAAGVLPANSVGAKQIKTRAVSLQKISPVARSALNGQQGDPGAPGAAGPKGDKADPGLAKPTVRNEAETAPSGGAINVDASCQSGERATGGGFI